MCNVNRSFHKKNKKALKNQKRLFIIRERKNKMILINKKKELNNIEQK